MLKLLMKKYVQSEKWFLCANTFSSVWIKYSFLWTWKAYNYSICQLKKDCYDVSLHQCAMYGIKLLIEGAIIFVPPLWVSAFGRMRVPYNYHLCDWFILLNGQNVEAFEWSMKFSLTCLLCKCPLSL